MTAGRAWLVPLLSAIIIACAEGGPTYHRDVRPIVEGRCVGCHQEGAIAPFALDSADALEMRAPAVVDAVRSRRMPPWSAGAADVRYRGNISLGDADIETIARWAEEGMREGDEAEFTGPLAVPEDHFMRADLEVALPEPYTPTTIPDEYRCFPLAWPEEAERFVTAINVLPGNIQIVHHVALFLVPPRNAGKPFTWDLEDDRPGYECFGGPSGGRDSTVPIVQLGAWLPGQSGNVYPDGIGIRVAPGSTLVVQMHYNVAVGTPEPDQSRFLFTLEDEVLKEAWYAPFLNLAWVLGAMEIPAGRADVVHTADGDPREFFELVAGEDLPFDRGFSVHAVMFHMHTLGVKGEVARVRRGLRTTFLAIERWDFDWQRQYVLEAPLEVLDGDELHLECVFDNARGEQTVNWGEGTGDEMCVANMLVTALAP